MNTICKLACKRLTGPVLLVALLTGCGPMVGIDATTAGTAARPSNLTPAGSVPAGSVTGGASVTGAAASAARSDTLTESFSRCLEPTDAAAFQAEVLSLVNRERSSRGLGTLVWNDTLADQAAQYACELIQYDFFDHKNPVTGSELQDRASEFQYEYWYIGENLAAGQRSPSEVMTDWMNSEGHRANILKPEFTELGIGIRSGGSYGLYWVQEFGRPVSAGRPR